MDATARSETCAMRTFVCSPRLEPGNPLDKAAGNKSLEKPMRTRILAFLIGLGIAGGALSPEGPEARAQTGTGAAIGAGVGALTGGLGGAVRGGLLGAGAGAAMESDEARSGAVTGAAVGAGVGLLTDGAGGALRGAAYGGAGGALIGRLRD